jgi:hypothetical protein
MLAPEQIVEETVTPACHLHDTEVGRIVALAQEPPMLDATLVVGPMYDFYKKGRPPHSRRRARIGAKHELLIAPARVKQVNSKRRYTQEELNAVVEAEWLWHHQVLFTESAELHFSDGKTVMHLVGPITRRLVRAATELIEAREQARWGDVTKPHIGGGPGRQTPEFLIVTKVWNGIAICNVYCGT